MAPVGFVPRKRGAAPANPPMSPDPNADLYGYALEMATGGVLTVTGPAPWGGTEYVSVNTPTGPSVRAAKQVRRRKELE